MERVNQVAIMFPHISRAAIENDMRRTNSAQATIDNILEGRLQQQRAADETPAGIPAPQSPSSYLTLLKKVNQSNEHIAEPPKVQPLLLMGSDDRARSGQQTRSSGSRFWRSASSLCCSRPASMLSPPFLFEASSLHSQQIPGQ